MVLLTEVGSALYGNYDLQKNPMELLQVIHLKPLSQGPVRHESKWHLTRCASGQISAKKKNHKNEIQRLSLGW